jgi:prepilin-type N-terminal cleavage/methylation domain-containing protein
MHTGSFFYRMSESFARLRREGKAEDGLSLVELLVAISVFALVMTAVIATLGGALTLTRNNKSRAVAANLAAQEMDVVRAASFTALAAGNVTSSQTVDNVKYTIDRDSEWLTSASTSSPCDSASGSSLSFLRVTVSVSWPQMAGTKPVTTQTIVTPPVGAYDPNTGHIAVKLRDRDAQPLENYLVTSVGASGTRTALTDAAGCAFFAFEPVGDYTVSLSTAGYVDGQGVSNPSQTVSVVLGAIVSLAFDYDQSASIQLTMSGSGSGTLPAAGLPVSLANTHYLPLGQKVFAAAPGPTRTLANLFPYSDGYDRWVGSCADADPEGQKPANGGPFYPGASRDATVAADPGAISSSSIVVQSVKVHVQRSTGVARVGATVVAVHAADNGCASGMSITFATTTDALGDTYGLLPFGLWTFTVSGRTPATVWPSSTLAPPAAGLKTIVAVTT